MNVDGTGVRRLAEALDVRGTAAWSPDGKWIAVGAMHGGAPQLFKIPLDGGPPVRLVDDYAVDPVWSPSDRFLVFSGADIGTNFSLGAVNADGTPHPLPPIVLSRGSRLVDFLDERQLVMLKGDLSYKELWVADLASGEERELTTLGPGGRIEDFDVSADGREIVLDRIRDESDIVLIELPRD